MVKTNGKKLGLLKKLSRGNESMKNKQRTPAQLLCDAIGKKIRGSHCCGNTPSLYIFLPEGILGRGYSVSSYITKLDGLKIYLELESHMSGTYDAELSQRTIFLVSVTCVTDYTNIVREMVFVDSSGHRNSYHIYSNLSVSISQMGNFVKELLSYLQYDVVSLRTVSNASMRTIDAASAWSSVDDFAFWRQVALARL